MNPFDPDPEHDATDRELVERARAGERAALEALLSRHQPWIYNLAFRMVLVPADAEDIAQEIAVKVITRLSTYDPERSAFRTWLYRIVANHVINMRTRGFEARVPRVDDYYGFVATVPDDDPAAIPEAQRIAADLAIGCTLGILLCLERTQRIAFVLAVAFDCTDAQGSEILEVSRPAFRKLLSRARERLQAFVQGNCGLVNPAAPCRCRNKVAGLVQLGAYGKRPLTFVAEPGTPTLAEVAARKLARFDDEIWPDYARVLREQPMYRAPTAWLHALVRRPDFVDVFELHGAAGRA
jgi:RNA polymerase sigma factor (sigma-70 family)